MYVSRLGIVNAAVSGLCFKDSLMCIHARQSIPSATTTQCILVPFIVHTSPHYASPDRRGASTSRPRNCWTAGCPGWIVREHDSPKPGVQELQLVLEKMLKFIGKNVRHVVEREDEKYCFRLHKNRVYYVRETLVKRATNVRF
jgi:hypothetical protein